MLKFPHAINHRHAAQLGVRQVAIWNNEKLGNEIACDFETGVEPFHTGAHRAVVFQAYGGGDTIYLVRVKDVRKFIIRNDMAKLIWHNAPFDNQVLVNEGMKDLVIEFYDNEQTKDTKTLYELYVLASTGKIPKEKSLAHVSATILGLRPDKDDNIRMTFGMYADMEYENMSEAHTVYAALDVAYTFQVYMKLKALIAMHDDSGKELSHSIQAVGDFTLNQIHINGIGVNQAEKEPFKKYLEDEMFNCNLRMSTWGVIKGHKGVNAAYDNAVEMLGIKDQLPTTPTGEITKSAKQLGEFMHIPFIKDWCEYLGYEKQYSFVSNLNTSVVHPQYHNLKVTGRTSCTGQKKNKPETYIKGINVQQLPREGKIRSLFVARNPENTIIDIDYDGIELSTLSQTLINLYGSSKMAAILNAGKDIHTATAALMFNKDPGPCTKDEMGEVTKKERQIAKMANFGFGANMSAETFVGNAAKQGVFLTLAQAEEIKAKWETTYDDMLIYYREPFNRKDGEKWFKKAKKFKATYAHFQASGRKRAFCNYTDWLNHGFQGMAADGLKMALWAIWKEGYMIISEVHDAIMVEVPKATAKADLEIISKIMVREMKKVCPDVRVGVEGAAVPHLGKDAEPLHKFKYWEI